MIFLSDLDNTLIFSYKKLSEEELCVETKDGKKLSFMTHAAAELFGRIAERIPVIPITTRSAEQYGRITFPHGYIPPYAIIDNGANLLVNGVCDEQWQERTRRIFKASLNEINEAKEYLSHESSVYFEIRTVDDAFLFTKCHDSPVVMERMRREICPRETEIFINGDKLYVIPREINKANALRMLRDRLGKKVIAAGDSLFDEDMLRASDIAVIKKGELSGLSLNKVQYAEEEGDDPDFTLQTLWKIISEEIV